MSVCWCNSTIDNWWSRCEDPWAAVRLTASGTASVRLTGCLGDAGTDRRWRGRQMTENERATVGVQHHLTRERERVCVCVWWSHSFSSVCLSDSFLAADSYAAAEQPRHICLNLRRSHTKNKSKAATTTTKKEPSVFFLFSIVAMVTTERCDAANSQQRKTHQQGDGRKQRQRWRQGMRTQNVWMSCWCFSLWITASFITLRSSSLADPFFDKSDNTLWNAPKLSISNQWMPCRHEAMNPSSPSKDFKWLLFKVAKLKYAHFCFRCVNRPYNTQ